MAAEGVDAFDVYSSKGSVSGVVPMVMNATTLTTQAVAKIIKVNKRTKLDKGSDPMERARFLVNLNRFWLDEEFSEGSHDAIENTFYALNWYRLTCRMPTASELKLRAMTVYQVLDLVVCVAVEYGTRSVNDRVSALMTRLG